MTTAAPGGSARPNDDVSNASADISLHLADGAKTVRLCRRIALTCSAIAIFITLLTVVGWTPKLLGWQRDWLMMAGKFTDDYIPMAPSTALSCMLFALAIAAHVLFPSHRLAWTLVALVALAVALWGALGILRLFDVVQFDIEDWLLGDRGRVGNAPQGRMSPFTAASCVLAGVALLLLVSDLGHGAKLTAAVLTSVLAGFNLWVLMSYTRDRPIEIQQWIGIPVSISTAIAWLVLGIGLIAAEGPDHFLSKLFIGPSTRALLLRAFMPVALIAILVGSMLAYPVLATLWALGAAVLFGVAISRIAEVVGDRIDRAELALNRTLEELRRARDAAEASNRAKTQFVANMSHELRTPLNAVIGYSEMLQEEAHEQGQESFLPDLEKINAAGKHLLALINDILDLAKIEAGKIELSLETFNVAALVQDVIATIRPVVEKKSNSLHTRIADDVSTMYADTFRLKQCLLNLLSNAGKFTENGKVTLDIACEKAESRDWIVFRVSDTGIGMTKEQMAKIFKAFTQADLSTTRKFGGTGLGLAISQTLCQMMGGRISVDSEPGKGSTFTMRIPAEVKKPQVDWHPEDSKVRPAPAVAKTGRPGVVLIIDDDATVRDMLQQFLTGEGFDVLTAASGADGLRIARQSHPQVITLDVMMPDMDGWSVLTTLKEDPTIADIPVIMLTIVEDRNLGYALGAAEYLVKPLDRTRLLGLLKKYCRTPSPGLALVVEDDASTREMLRRMLEKGMWSVAEASNGREALECVASQRPALILLDLMMPEMDGFEFLTEMRQHPEWKSIPVIVITAKDLSAEDRLFLNGSLLLSSSVKRVLEKGKFGRDDLLREVRSLVNSRL
jgi:signal transduction histidine kinase/CheY-like chemotaxis protein